MPWQACTTTLFLLLLFINSPWAYKIYNYDKGDFFIIIFFLCTITKKKYNETPTPHIYTLKD